jgi:hypothetical protein
MADEVPKQLDMPQIDFYNIGLWKGKMKLEFTRDNGDGRTIEVDEFWIQASEEATLDVHTNFEDLHVAELGDEPVMVNPTHYLSFTLDNVQLPSTPEGQPSLRALFEETR